MAEELTDEQLAAIGERIERLHEWVPLRAEMLTVLAALAASRERCSELEARITEVTIDRDESVHELQGEVERHVMAGVNRQALVRELQESVERLTAERDGLKALTEQWRSNADGDFTAFVNEKEKVAELTASRDTCEAEHDQLQNEFNHLRETCNLEWARKREAEQANGRLRAVVQGLADLDWTAGYELTREQHVYLDKLRDQAAALVEGK